MLYGWFRWVTLVIWMVHLLQPLPALAESMRLPLEQQNLGMVRQPIQERTGQGGIAEDLYPAREFQIACDQDTSPLVSLSIIPLDCLPLLPI